MYFSLFILSASLSTFSCEAAILDYSKITPWSVVYEDYPIYDNPWVKVWKNEASLDVTDSAVNIELNSEQRVDSNIHKTISSNNNSDQTVSSNTNTRNNQNINPEQQTQTHSWPLTYINWHKNSNKPTH